MSLFPEIEPYDSGHLEVGDGQRIFWETSGDPRGTPAVVLHGGPGSGSTPDHRRLFDPDRFRIVTYDQRGAGRSTPRVHVATELATNTTAHLVGDLQRLRSHLGIERWVVFGSSWGSTLALAYAERHPERVRAMVLAPVTMTRAVDVHWLAHEAGRFLPEQWTRFRDAVPDEGRHDLVAAYHRLLNGQPDVAVREEAARHWCAWEDALVSLEPGWSPNPRYGDPAFRITFARLVTHYFFHHGWLGENEILEQAHRLADIPAVLVHGRLDISGPLVAAWELAQAWPRAELRVVATGHSGGPAMTGEIVAATTAFAGAR